MSVQIETVRQVARQFCMEFVADPYLCYTEHGLHARLFTMLYNALPSDQRYTRWEGRKVCVVQKEYPTAHRLGKSRRQNWDLAVIKTPLESAVPEGRLTYDYLRLAAAVELGMNEAADHLQDDIDRLCHEKAHVDQGFIVQLYRLSQSKARVSGRDWSASSSRILSVDEVAEMAAGKPVEILYALADASGQRPSGVWFMNTPESGQTERTLEQRQDRIGPVPRSRIALCSGDAGPKSQRTTPSEAADFFPEGRWVGRVRNAANSLGVRFFVLTTGYGLVEPDAVLGAYDLPIQKNKPQVDTHWRQTIPQLIRASEYDIMVFYPGGCPPDLYVKLLAPILQQQGVSLVTFGRPNMYDSNKIEPFVELLTKGASLEELRSLLGQPERLQYFPAGVS
jgi:hypothetical protein